MVVQNVAPSDVRFTQDSISEVFGDRGQTLEAETIEGTFRKLLYGDVSVNSIRTISVVRKDNRIWVVSGNRRLYVFKKLQEYGRIREIPVNVIQPNMERFDKMFTTKNDGLSIYIRQDRKRRRGDKLEDRLRTIYLKWAGHGRPTDGYPSVFTDVRSFDATDGYPSVFADVRSFDASSFSGGYSKSPPPRSPTFSSPRASYVEPAWPATLPRRPPPAPEKKDESWCTIL